MAGAVIELFPENPPKEQLVIGGGVFTTLHVERAPDVAGAPGAFVELVPTVPIDLSDEYTYYADQAGDDTAWYRHRFSNGAAVFSGYGPITQAGDSVIRQSVRSEIPDLDISVTLWDRWGREVMIDLFTEGIWKPDEGQLVITSTGNIPDEGYAVPAHIREVIAIETRDQYGRHSATLEWGADREEGDYQLGPTNRRIRLFDPVTASSTQYWVVGKAQYRTLGELTNDFYVIAIHMLLVKYAMYRQHQRLNWKKFITFDPTTDILPKDIGAFIQQEKIEVATRAAKLALPEPAIPIPY